MRRKGVYGVGYVEASPHVPRATPLTWKGEGTAEETGIGKRESATEDV